MMFKILLILPNSFDLVQKKPFPIEKIEIENRTITSDNMNSEIIRTMFRLRHDLNAYQIAVNFIQ